MPMVNDTMVSTIVIAAPWASEVDVSEDRKTVESKFTAAYRCGANRTAPTGRPALSCQVRGPDGSYWTMSRTAGSMLYLVAMAARVPSSLSTLMAAVRASPSSVLPFV